MIHWLDHLQSRGEIKLAVGIACVLHLMLFFFPTGPEARMGHQAHTPPTTSLLVQSEGTATRIPELYSPLLFSFPSDVGFSHVLDEEVDASPLHFSVSTHSAHYLQVNAIANAEPVVYPDKLKTGVFVPAGKPRLSAPALAEAIHMPSDRVSFSAALQERVTQRTPLPDVLNQPVDEIWKVAAEVMVSPRGAVEHVLLEQPLESAAMNQAALQWLYGLKFMVGDQEIDGRVEISAPLNGNQKGVDQ